MLFITEATDCVEGRIKYTRELAISDRKRTLIHEAF